MIQLKNKHSVEVGAISLNNKIKRLYEIELVYLDTKKEDVCRVLAYNALAASIITIKRLAKKGIEPHKIHILSTSHIHN